MTAYGGRFDIFHVHDGIMARICLPLFIEVEPKNGLTFTFEPSDNEYGYTATTYHDGMEANHDEKINELIHEVLEDADDNVSRLKSNGMRWNLWLFPTMILILFS